MASDTQITNALKAIGIADVSLYTEQCFLRCTIPPKNSTDEKVCEFAIGIKIMGNQSSSGFDIFKLDEVYIRVWNTTNKAVLKEMNIWTHELLEAASEN